MLFSQDFASFEAPTQALKDQSLEVMLLLEVRMVLTSLKRRVNMAYKNEIVITINGERYELEKPVVSGRALKELAKINLADTLFLNVPGCDDAVVHNDLEIRLETGMCFYSCPPAKYGDQIELKLSDEYRDQLKRLPQPDGWCFVILRDFQVPEAYQPNQTQLLVKLPPRFPDANPDMFWVHPHLRLCDGRAPKATSTEHLLGRPWQRFSWHLQPGAWRPGTSSFMDFLNCIKARFARGD